MATEGLVFLSDLMLGMSPVMIALHLGMVAILCVGLSGISVGLGARLPNLRETDPSKIAVGFGGTLNLLVSLVFIFAIVTALAIPCHLYFLGVEHPDATSLALSHGGFRFWLTVAILVSLVIGAVGTIVPLRIGIKAFRADGILSRQFQRTAMLIISRPTAVHLTAAEFSLIQAIRRRPAELNV